ncbi:unnamed protein product [Closterium sp. NIES-54]
MGQIREKPDWMRKVTDDEIVKRWKAELTEKAADVHPDGFIDASKEYWSAEEASAVLSFLRETTTRPVKIDPALFAYAISELRWLASSLSSSSSSPPSSPLSSLSLHGNPKVLPSAVDGVFISPDPPLDPSLKQLFLDGITTLESVPEDQIDYHPGSNHQVVDLIHPSLHCLVFGRTRVIQDPPNDLQILPWDELVSSLGEVARPMLPGQPTRPVFYPTGNHSYLSEKFQWLPAEVDVTADGQSAKFRSYINNLHPHEFAGMYRGLEHIFASAFVPLFNKVLTEAVQQRRERFDYDIYGWYDEWKGEREYDKDDDDDYHQWLVDRQPKQPDTPAEFSPPVPPSPGHVVDLKGRRLQVVVKVASIQLTPESPRYPGGTWHVEGMRNEHIAVAPFELQDKTRAGHRKILVFFLVDPRVAIVSTARVPPQQLSWQRRELERKGHPCSVLPGLALDLIAQGVGGGEGRGVEGEGGGEGRGESTGVEREGGEEGRGDEGADGGEEQSGGAESREVRGVGEESKGVDSESRDGRGAAMTMEEAKKYREALMEERKALVQLANEELFERPFSLCEH